MTPPDNPRQTLRRRLLLVGILTAVLVGLITWYAESERIDDKVLALAVTAANRISPNSLETHARGELSEAALLTMVEQMAADHFGIVELYDHSKTRLIEYVPPELEYLEEELKRGGHVELAAQPRYMKHMIQGEFALVVAVPIARAGEAPVGYMEGLAGESIPLNARIFAVVDVFDALTSRRPYKDPMTPTEATNIMLRDRGTHFDPHLLDRFLPLAAHLHEDYGQADETRLREILLPALERYFMTETG